MDMPQVHNTPDMYLRMILVTHRACTQVYTINIYFQHSKTCNCNCLFKHMTSWELCDPTVNQHALRSTTANTDPGDWFNLHKYFRLTSAYFETKIKNIYVC